MTRDLTRGPEFRTVLRFSLPMILGAFAQQIYSVTDSLVVGNVIGPDALAAVGAAGPCIFFLLSLNSGLANACSIVIAQHFGANSDGMVKTSLASAAYYTLCCSAVLSLLGLVSVGPLLRLLQTPADIFSLAELYLKIYMGGAFGQILYNNAAAAINSLGDSRTPLLFLLLASVLNIALDFLFVAGFHMGVAGAAVATVLAQIISGVLCVAYAVQHFPVFHLSWVDMRPDFRNIGVIAKLGIPMGLQSSVLAVGDMALMGIINTCGSAVVAAYSAAYRIHEFAVIPFLYFAMGFCTFAAQNMGANQMQRLRRTLRKSALFVTAVALALAALISISKYALIGMFLPEGDIRTGEILKIAGDFLGYVPLLYPFLALIWLYNHALRGVGVVAVPVVSGIIELAAKIVLPYILGKYLGYIGVWYGYPLCWVLGLIPSFFYFHWGRWNRCKSAVRY